MNNKILSFVNKCEGWKTAIKELHWDSKNLSQHKLCDDIADRIADFQDQVSEVEQSISGNLPFNKLKGTPYKVIGLKPFVEDVIADAKSFLKELEKMGDDYVGMKSDCESFISDMQRNLYLVNFTLKESMKERIKGILSEKMYKNVPVVDEEGNQVFDKLNGRQPKTIKARIARIYKIVRKYGIDSRRYKDDHWQAIDDYISAIDSLGCKANVWCENGGYTDRDPEDGMPRSKEYKIEITYNDGMVVYGYIKCMACGTIEDPFSAYDTCMVLWPKPKRELGESISKKRMKSIIEAAVSRIARPNEFRFMAEVDVEDVDEETSRTVELPFKCTVREEPPEPDVNYGGVLEFNDIQLDIEHARGMLSDEEGAWVVNEWLPNNLDYLEDVAEREYSGYAQWEKPDMFDNYNDYRY